MSWNIRPRDEMRQGSLVALGVGMHRSVGLSPRGARKALSPI